MIAQQNILHSTHTIIHHLVDCAVVTPTVQRPNPINLTSNTGGTTPATVQRMIDAAIALDNIRDDDNSFCYETNRW